MLLFLLLFPLPSTSSGSGNRSGKGRGGEGKGARTACPEPVEGQPGCRKADKFPALAEITGCPVRADQKNLIIE
ncbi:Uncharacterized protein dnm_059710 [Desulfonema magnum]|uniref:Uncharacterized protein n=1 Tax=Desulfonema magnum TaxID=45655 RepID=A0A975BR54_9BACT|nr:Uncharacterized protein dnm_059710 [Desulfonema magnum]